MFPSWEQTSGFLVLCISGLVLMLEVQSTKKVALQEEHPVSPSTIKELSGSAQ